MGDRLLSLSETQRIHRCPSHVAPGERLPGGHPLDVVRRYIADRWINSERLMGICHLLGAGLLYLMATVTSPDQYTLLFAIPLVTRCFITPPWPW